MPDNMIEQRLAHTTVNLSELHKYFNEDPGYLKAEVEAGNDMHSRMLANHADYFEYWLRRYVSGRAKTLHRVFVEVREFIKYDEDEARLLIPLLIEGVSGKLLTNEWYELIPRCQYAHRRIRQTFSLA
jgi:hypothetical protein